MTFGGKEDTGMVVGVNEEATRMVGGFEITTGTELLPVIIKVGEEINDGT